MTLQPARSALQAKLRNSSVIETPNRVGVERVGTGRVGRTKTPVFVHPEPGRWVLPNDGLETVPAKLRDLLIGCASRDFEPGMKHDSTAAAGQRFLVDRHDRHPGAAMKPGMGVGDRCLHPEHVDHHRGLPRVQGEIDENRRGAVAPERLVEPDDRPFALDKVMPRLFAQPVEDRVEERIPELLRNDRCDQTFVGRGQAEPLEVAVVAGGDNAGTGRANRAGKLSPAGELDEVRPIVSIDSRVPKKIDHRAGKLLIGLARDPSPLRRGITRPENHFEIAERDPPAFTIEMRRESAGNPPELDGAPPRQLRDQESKQSHPEPFEPVTNRFPVRQAFPSVVRQLRKGAHFEAARPPAALT